MAGEPVQANSYPQLRSCRRQEYLEDPTGCSQWVLRLRSQELDARAMEISAHLYDSRERKPWLQAPDYGSAWGSRSRSQVHLLTLPHPALSPTPCPLPPPRACPSVLFRESRRTHPPVPRGGVDPKHLTRGSTQGSSTRLVSLAILAL